MKTSTCPDCEHEREAHDFDNNLEFNGKCLMKDDKCKCKKFVPSNQSPNGSDLGIANPVTSSDTQSQKIIHDPIKDLIKQRDIIIRKGYDTWNFPKDLRGISAKETSVFALCGSKWCASGYTKGEGVVPMMCDRCQERQRIKAEVERVIDEWTAPLSATPYTAECFEKEKELVKKRLGIKSSEEKK